MAFYSNPNAVDFEKLQATLDADFNATLDAPPERRVVNGFDEPPTEPRTRAGLGVDFIALRSPLPTFSTNEAWRQKVEIVRKLNNTERGKHILKNPFLSYVFLRSTDNINYQTLIKKHPLWRALFD